MVLDCAIGVLNSLFEIACWPARYALTFSLFFVPIGVYIGIFYCS